MPWTKVRTLKHFETTLKIDKLRGSMIFAPVKHLKEVITWHIPYVTYARVLTHRIWFRNFWSFMINWSSNCSNLNFGRPSNFQNVSKIQTRTVGSHVIKNFGEKVRRKIQEHAYHMLHSMLSRDSLLQTLYWTIIVV